MRLRVARRPLLQVAAVTAGLTSTSAFAAEWLVAPGADISERTQRNPHLSPDKNDEKEMSTGVNAQASLLVQRRTERLTLSLQSLFGTYRFPDSSDLDRNDEHIDLSFNWLGEKVSWSGAAMAARDTTLTSELGNTGLTQGNSRHETYTLSFGPGWALSDRLHAQTSVSLYSSRYPGTLTSLEDYNYNTAMANMSYVLTDRATLSVIGSAGRLDSEGPGSNTDNASISLQARYIWSPVLSFGAGLGPSRTKTDQGQQRGLIYSAEVTRAFETAALSFSVSRKQAPSGRAVLTESDEATLTFSAQITERLTGTATAGMTRRRNSLRDFDLDLTRVRYTRADLGVSWRMASSWRLNASIGNAVQQLGSDFTENSTGRGYEARLGLSWSGDPYVK
jgi:hypothetical protein